VELNQSNQVNAWSEARHFPAQAAIVPVSTYRQSVDRGRLEPIASWLNYMIDAAQRSVLFLDLLRQRGNEQIEITSRPMATVLIFDQELLMDGRSLPRPINYTLSRIIAPPGVVTEPTKRPVVVIDPRAGQGPGVGGFKAESEIGDALNAGHPVYFIGFSATPAAGQQFLDVVEGQISFFEQIATLHPKIPPPFVIGNCQAGYQTLMVAALRPELFGPCMVAGSPMSYWQGVHGKNPMRYAAGLLGGSWSNAMSADFGNGKIDGTQLILNFDLLNPAYWLWGKQYEVYAQVDRDAVRYLKFEKWWGDFIELNGDELQFLVDNMFIGDKLARNQLQAHNGTTFDLRNITSPIIVFTSMADNISPPQQSLGWILDLYPEVADIQVSERTIVYCLSQEVGHLAIFVSSKVGAKQDEEFVQLMDVIDCLPPGLFEMVIAPRPADVPSTGFITGQWIARFEDRSLDDIRALGRNSLEDDRSFAAVARMSEINLSLYRTFMQPMVRALANQPMASMTRTMAPLRLSYTLFADRNPLMKGVQTMATAVTSMRRPVTADNPFLAVQEQVSQHITAALDAWRDARDSMEEKVFFGFYGSSIVQAMLGIHDGTEVRARPTVSAERVAAQKVRADGYAAKLKTGGYNAALARAVLYVTEADQMIEQRTALAFNVARENIMHLSLGDFRVLVREQFFVLQLAGEQAVSALASMVVKADARKELMKQIHAIVGAGDPPSVAENERLTKLSHVLLVPIDTAVIPVVCDPCCTIDKSLIVSRSADALDVGDHCIATTDIGNISQVPSATKSNALGKLQ
jgi:hypothetical protein